MWFLWRRVSKNARHNVIFFSISAIALIGGALLLWVASFDIPTLENFAERKVTQSTKIYDRTGDILLYDVFSNVKRTIVPFEEISQHAKDAAIAIEDEAFYEHNGIRISSFLRAVFINLITFEFSQGGSTITQQVVKNSLLTNEKLISRKIKEWVLALKLEKILTKDEILSLYLNEIPYGGSIYGIEEASNAFFNKTAQDLTLAEAVYLAALPQAPSYYSPYGEHRDELEARKNLVLKRMLEYGFITRTEYEEALDTQVVFEPQSETGIKAPHFVMYVKKQLEEIYGEGVLENGGLRVITSLDYDLQSKAEELALTHAQSNQTTYNAENIALVATDPKTGEILTMVGSRDYFDEEIDGNFNITTAYRQPGSAFKPFAYAAAFAKGFTPETILFDLETQFSTSCSPEGVGENCYTPGNYDSIFRGPMTMRNALAQSVNIPAVKTLYLAGMRNVINLARDIGISNLDDYTRYGLTLVLGGGEVRLLDMVGAYGTFANEGVKNEFISILEVQDKDGAILKKTEPKSKTVLERNVALTVTDVLADNSARAPAFGQNSFLNFSSYDVAVKTGTTNNYRDAWIIGYTPSIAAGAWAGNNDNTPMDKRVAGFIIAPFWNEFMQFALTHMPREEFAEPLIDTNYSIHPMLRGKWQGSESVVIDTVSGKLATEFTPEETKEEILYGPVHSILGSVNKNNPLGPPPQNPESDPQYMLWEFPVQKWLDRQGFTPNLNPDIPTEFDDVHTRASRPEISIINPHPQSTISQNEMVTIEVDIDNDEISRIDYYIQEKLIGTRSDKPFIFTFKPSDLGIESGRADIKVTVTDEVFNTNTDTVSVTIGQ